MHPPDTTNPTTHPRLELYELPIHQIAVDAQQLRTDHEIDDIEELALDIQQHGLLQAIGVVRTAEDRYQLLYGSRRLAAHRYLHRTEILARIHDTSEPIKAIALVENIHRAQLTLEEEVRAVIHLHDEGGRPPEAIAALLAKSRAWVLRRLAIPQLPTDLRAPLLDGRLSLGAAEELARISDQSQRDWLRSQAQSARLSVPELRAMRESMQTLTPDPAAVDAAVTAGMHAPAPPKIYLECAACHARREHSELTLVRICADGCEQPSHADA